MPDARTTAGPPDIGTPGRVTESSLPPPLGKPSAGLGATAARGAVVVLSGQAARVLLQLTGVVVLARFLEPSDFGLLAMTLVVIGVGEIFRDFGLSTAAIRSPSVSREQRDNLFWVNSGIGLILGAAAFSASGLIASFYDQPDVVVITRMLALVFVFNGLATQYRADLTRRLRFTALAGSDVCAQALGLLSGILLAVNGFGFWALVAQQLVQGGIGLLLVIACGRWVPRPPRRGVDMSGFTRFGWNLTWAQIISYLSNNVDTLIIGVRFGAGPLGYYNRAFQLLMYTLSQLRAPSTTVALPVLARLHDEPDRFNAYLLRAQLALGYTLVVGLGLAVGAAEPIIEVALGERWLPAVSIFRFLALAGIFQTLAYVAYWTYLSRDLTADLFRYTVLTSVIKVACIVLGSQWGVLGVAIGYTVAHALEWPLSLWWLSRRTSFPAKGLMFGAVRILIVTGMVIVGTALVVQFLPVGNALLLLVLAVLCGLAVLGLSAVFARPISRDLGSVVEIIRSVRRR